MEITMNGNLAGNEGAEVEKPAMPTEEQYENAADTAGTAATGHEVELRSYEYYREVYSGMDWTPEEENLL